jgi:putative nucleotidyltransferase with HDIG domain
MAKKAISTLTGNTSELLERIRDLEDSLEYEKKLNKNLEQDNVHLRKALEQTITILVNIAEMKDPYTVGHQKRVSQLATAIAKKMNLPEEKVEFVRIASLIHDIGKVSVPSEILNKPSKLTDSEFALIKNHPSVCYKYIKDIDFPRKVADIILQHHEKMNGTGYPNGLRNREILLEAKIVSVADVVESMDHKRPYRPALGIDKALEEISKNKGKLYDPAVVETCIKLIKEDGFEFKNH